MKQLGERIKLVRGIVSQSDFSTKIGVSQNALSRYERGVNAPDIESVQKICSLYKIEPKWLVFGEGSMRLGEPAQPAEKTPETPANTPETMSCARCAEMKAELEEERRERREVSTELREVNAENRRLARENMELSKQCATLTERQKACCPDPLLQQPPPSAPSSETRAKA